ncbi:cytochrome bd oxidase small subunit CydS [Gracilibacillus sp. HCP3S3_G5_1]
MSEFIIFYAPFIILIISIIFTFWFVTKDNKIN